MSEVHVLCGIPGSGKSTKGKELAREHNAVYLSTDERRIAMFGENSYDGTEEDREDRKKQLYAWINAELKDALAQNRNVVYDANNSNRRIRVYLNDELTKGHDVIVHTMLTPYEQCLQQNLQRAQQVPEFIIQQTYHNFQMPFTSHGFQQVHYYVNPEKVIDREKMENVLLSDCTYDELFSVLLQYPPFKHIYDLAQDSKYHSFSVSRHTYYVWKELKKNEFSTDSLAMAYAGVFHDLGKGFTKSFLTMSGEEGRYAHFIGHENVSTYLMIQYLKNAGYDDDFILRTAQIVSYHMLPKNLGRKTKRRLQKWLSESQFQDLNKFNECDKAAK